MSGKTQSTGIVVKDYLHKYPSVPSKKIAELITKEVPGLFANVDAARIRVRYYRGAGGVKNRSYLNEDTYIPKVSIVEPIEEPDYTPYMITDNDYPISVGFDAHIPYFDQDALELFIEYSVEIGAKTILLAGDWLDFYQLSRFIKDPRRRNVQEEIDMLKQILQQIKKVLPKAKIIYKYGNHEERYDNYVMTNAPQLFHLETTHLESQLGLKEMGITVVKDKRIIKAKHLHIIHGHEYVYSISNPVNPARGLYNRAKKSAMCGHFHQSSEHTEPAINGDVVTCWSVGCLCNLHPEYMPLNKWGHGFASILAEDDMFTVQNKKIVNYRIL